MSTIIKDIVSTIKEEKLRDLLLIFWGNTGYINYDIITKNKKTNILKFVEELHYLETLDFINDFDEISDTCDNINNYICIDDFNKIFQAFNKNKLYSIIPEFTHVSKSITNLSILPNRWMSFSKHTEINQKSEGFGNFLIKIPINENTKNLKFMETYGFCDLNEILINSYADLKVF